jgi:hypothetical protein
MQPARAKVMSKKARVIFRRDDIIIVGYRLKVEGYRLAGLAHHRIF